MDAKFVYVVLEWENGAIGPFVSVNSSAENAILSIDKYFEIEKLFDYADPLDPKLLESMLNNEDGNHVKGTDYFNPTPVIANDGRGNEFAILKLKLDRPYLDQLAFLCKVCIVSSASFI